MCIFEGVGFRTHFLREKCKQEQPLSKKPPHQFPTQFISKKISHFIYDNKNQTIITDRYEYECYRQIATYLNGRSLFLSGSINYQSLNDELTGMEAE